MKSLHRHDGRNDAEQKGKDMLEGKVAVVTGASRGIGRAIALRLAQEKAAVVINYNGSREKAEEVVQEIEAAGGTACAIHCVFYYFSACVGFL